MAQLLGAKELHFLVANPLILYDYAYDTKLDNWCIDRFQYLLVHNLLNINLI
jgi:hypothetical protein